MRSTKLKEEMHAPDAGEEKDPDYEDDDDVDTLGLQWEASPELGGAPDDSASVAVSAITAPTALRQVDHEVDVISSRRPQNPPEVEQSPPPTKFKEDMHSPDAGEEKVPDGDGHKAEPNDVAHQRGGKIEKDKNKGAAATNSQGNYSTTVVADGMGRISLPPGAYRIPGPGTADNHALTSSEDNDNQDIEAASNNNEEEVIIEGFVPTPTPEEIIQQEVQEMLRSAITLDDDQVTTVPTSPQCDGNNDETGNCENPPVNGNEIEKREEKLWWHSRLKSPVAFVSLTILMLLAIALGVASFGSDADNNNGDSTNESESIGGGCIPKTRSHYAIAKSIVLEITPEELLLDDDTTPSSQSKALQWIVCEDEISMELIDNRDPSTDVLPTQPHGTKYGGKSGESQVLRRYALATLYYATSEDGPWGLNRLNFLSPNKHECSWHYNLTRENFPHGEIDPVGFHCVTMEGTYILDDEGGVINDTAINIRVPNNLTGTFPPEFGHLEDLTAVRLEQQSGLRGSIPSTIGNMTALDSFSIQFVGPEFGGMVPSSLFSLPWLKWISIYYNEGVWSLPPSIDCQSNSSLTGVSIASSGLSGNMPSFSAKCANLQVIDLAKNSLGGSIHESVGNLASLEYLNLHGNTLIGTLPESLGQFPNLHTL